MFGDKLKRIFMKDTDNKKIEGNDKKKIENLVFFVVLLIIIIIAINLIWNDNKTSTKQEDNTSTKKLASKLNEENLNNEINSVNSLEQKLEAILSKIQGVGRVKVFVNYSETSEVVAMYNENSKVSSTEENDKSGGNRKIEQTDIQKDIIYKEENGEKTPITQKVIQPKVQGAIIAAEGASNAVIKTNIIQAVEAVTGLATHKIQVFEME